MTKRPKPVAHANFPRKPGQALPNGAIILVEWELRSYEFRRDSLVFALIPGNVHPFVSWHRVVTTDSPLATGGFHIVDSTAFGDYGREMHESFVKFQERFKEKEAALGDMDEANEEGKERLRLESNA